MNTTITDYEEIVDIVSDWAVEVLEDAISRIMPDGKSFGHSLMSEEEQMNEYMKLRGSPDAFFRYIDGKAREIINRLSADGVDEEKIQSCHPYDIAVSVVLDWSARMEGKIRDTA